MESTFTTQQYSTMEQGYQSPDFDERDFDEKNFIGSDEESEVCLTPCSFCSSSLPKLSAQALCSLSAQAFCPAFCSLSPDFFLNLC